MEGDLPMEERKEEEEKRRRIMISIDESEFSRYALDWTLDNLAGNISASGSPLVVFTAQNEAALDYGPVYVNAAVSHNVTAASPARPIHSFDAPASSRPLIHSLKDHQKKVSLHLLEKAEALCAQRGVAVEAITEVGDPKETICELIEKFKIGMLILGSHGRGALQRVFLGSVSSYCVQNAKCPVIVVKKTE